MPPVVTLDSVTTGDSQPTTEPHRISDKPGKDSAEVRFTVGVAAEPDVKCYRIFLGGVTSYVLPSAELLPSEELVPTKPRESGIEVGRRGVICGHYHKCDSELACSDWQWPAGDEILEFVAHAETGPQPDGIYDVNIYALQDGEWNG